MKVDISIGELFDKITILNIKSKKFSDESKIVNVTKELSILKPLSNPIVDKYGEQLTNLVAELTDVNSNLWDVEDKLRILERDKDFGDEFVELARSVYILNDRRAVVKKQINLLTDSGIVEEKGYVKYD